MEQTDISQNMPLNILSETTMDRPVSPIEPPPNAEEVQPPIHEYKTWDELNLNHSLLRGIYAYGFEAPSPIQKIAIHPIDEGRDIIAQAQSGTGKTGAFTVGTLQRIDITKKQTQAIILAPTHELVKQITSVIEGIGSSMEGLIVKMMIGGTSILEDAIQMRTHTPHVIVGTIGRVYDMIRRRNIRTQWRCHCRQKFRLICQFWRKCCHRRTGPLARRPR
jgi:superfamily II DNA/RNA helicase